MKFGLPKKGSGRPLGSPFTRGVQVEVEPCVGLSGRVGPCLTKPTMFPTLKRKAVLYGCHVFSRTVRFQASEETWVGWSE